MVTSTLKLPKITVVTPSYNQGDFLERCIRSVLDQRYPNLEYIMMDGGSTDNTQRILRKYRSSFAHVQSQPDGGQSAAIMEGMRRSTGEIQCWLNSDDVFLPGCLHLIGELFVQHPQIAWLTGQPACITPDEHLVRPSIRVGRLSPLIQLGLYHGKGFGFLGQENTFWRRELWEKTKPQLTHYHYAMDYNLWKLFAAHASVVSVEAILAAFRLNPDRKTQNLQGYYAEISPFLRYVPKHITWPVRLLHPLVLRPLSPSIFYDEKTTSWQFSPGPFFSPGIY